jgi:SlyX protein
MDRIDALEMRVAEQERTIEDLSTTVARQWTLIETMSKRLARVEDEVVEAELSARAGGPEKPPPHY